MEKRSPEKIKKSIIWSMSRKMPTKRAAEAISIDDVAVYMPAARTVDATVWAAVVIIDGQ